MEMQEMEESHQLWYIFYKTEKKSRRKKMQQEGVGVLLKRINLLK